MSDITIDFDASRVTVGDLLDMEEGTTKERMTVLSRFVKNGTGEFLPADEGMQKIRALTLSELQELVTTITTQLQEQADPN